MNEKATLRSVSPQDEGKVKTTQAANAHGKERYKHLIIKRSCRDDMPPPNFSQQGRSKTDIEIDEKSQDKQEQG